MVEGERRKSGIGVIGEVPWGTHFCQFYKTKGDLIDLLVPYFKQGLEQNEFCMWVTSEPLSVEEAEAALRRTVPDLDRYLAIGQLEIIPYTDWYRKGGTFEADRVLNGWIEKLDRARAKGFDGLRLTGNTFWLESKEWQAFTDYEQKVNSVIGQFRMMALCTYSLDKCGASEVVDVVSNHQFALIKRQNRWTRIESAEQRRVEAALQESLNRYQALAESLPHLVWTCLPDGRCEYLSRQWIEYTGIPEASQLGYGWLDRIHPDDQRRVQDAWNSAVREGDKFDVEFRIRRADGQYRWFKTRAVPFRDAAGRVTRWFGSNTDIDDSKWMEESLRKLTEELETRVRERTVQLAGVNATLEQEIREHKRAEERLARQQMEQQVLLDLIPAMVWYKDLENRILRANRAAAASLNKTPAEIEGKSFYDLYPEEAEQYYQDDKEVIASGNPKLGIIELLQTASGSKHWIQTDKVPYRDARGNMVGILVFAQDITERKRTEEALRQNEQLLTKVLEALPVGIWIQDTTGRIVQGNPAGHQIWAGARYVGIEQFGEYRGWWAATGRRIEPEEWAAARAIRKGETSLNEEIIIECFDGTTKTILNSALPIRDETQQITGAVIVNQDISKLKQIQEQAQRMSRLAALGQLLSGIAHELKNPLFILSGELQLLQAKMEQSHYKVTPADLRKMEVTLHRITEVVKRFVELARPSRHFQERCVVQTILEQLLVFLANELMKNGITLVKRLTPDLPDLWADPHQLQDIFLNLMMNAVQAMSAAHGRGTLTVTATLVADRATGGRATGRRAPRLCVAASGEGETRRQGEGGNWIEVRIQDDGPGIPSEHRPKLFEPFFSTKPPEQGTGIGLWIVRSTLMTIGGTVAYETEVGKGTTFIVRLPAEKSDRPSAIGREN